MGRFCSRNVTCLKAIFYITGFSLVLVSCWSVEWKSRQFRWYFRSYHTPGSWSSRMTQCTTVILEGECWDLNNQINLSRYASGLWIDSYCSGGGLAEDSWTFGFPKKLSRLFVSYEGLCSIELVTWIKTLSLKRCCGATYVNLTWSKTVLIM
jgi:hypothetical protein